MVASSTSSELVCISYLWLIDSEPQQSRTGNITSRHSYPKPAVASWISYSLVALGTARKRDTYLLMPRNQVTPSKSLNVTSLQPCREYLYIEFTSLHLFVVATQHSSCCRLRRCDDATMRRCADVIRVDRR